MTPGKDSSDEPVEHRPPAEPSAPVEQPTPANRDPAADRAETPAEAAETDHEDVSETVMHAARSEDRPMERKTPQAPFALVGLSYFTVLAVIGLIIGIVLFWLSR